MLVPQLHQFQAELFKPPYAFSPARPVITSADDQVAAMGGQVRMHMAVVLVAFHKVSVVYYWCVLLASARPVMLCVACIDTCS